MRFRCEEAITCRAQGTARCLLLYAFTPPTSLLAHLGPEQPGGHDHCSGRLAQRQAGASSRRAGGSFVRGENWGPPRCKGMERLCQGRADQSGAGGRAWAGRGHPRSRPGKRFPERGTLIMYCGLIGWRSLRQVL